jgi:hypothetical protein
MCEDLSGSSWRMSSRALGMFSDSPTSAGIFADVAGLAMSVRRMSRSANDIGRHPRPQWPASLVGIFRFGAFAAPLRTWLFRAHVGGKGEVMSSIELFCPPRPLIVCPRAREKPWALLRPRYGHTKILRTTERPRQCSCTAGGAGCGRLRSRTTMAHGRAGEQCREGGVGVQGGILHCRRCGFLRRVLHPSKCAAGGSFGGSGECVVLRGLGNGHASNAFSYALTLSPFSPSQR